MGEIVNQLIEPMVISELPVKIYPIVLNGRFVFALGIS